MRAYRRRHLKSVFTLHGVDERGRPILRRHLSRARFEEFLGKTPRTEAVLEACGGSHHWGRVARALGLEVQPISPQYVEPFVERGRNDRNDAGSHPRGDIPPHHAFSAGEVRREPGRGDGPERARPAGAAADPAGRRRARARGGVRRDRGEGIAQVEPPPARIAEADMPPAELGRLLAARHKADPVGRRLAAVPGIGPLTALTLAVTVDACRFESGRHFAAWPGLTPRERSTGGRQRLGGIGRAGNERLRQPLVVGATAVIRHAGPTSKAASPWLPGLLEPRPRELAAVALADEMARVLWAMMANGTAYRRSPQAA